MSDMKRVFGCHYDSTITLGHILTFFGFILAGFGAYTGTMVELRSLGVRLKIVETRIEALPEVLSQTSRQDERTGQIVSRLSRMENRIIRLEDYRK